jgi:Fe-S-cluster containining protein
LLRSSAWSLEHQIGRGRQPARGIAASAIYHKDLVRALLPEQKQCVADAAFFIQGRYDNRDAHARLTRELEEIHMPEPWYQDGLRFRCTRCGNCCTGEPGYVWVNDEELTAIAGHRGETVQQVTALYTRQAGTGRSLREKANGDCVFYDRAQGCTIYPVRPRQCRTWPFWESNVRTPEAWGRTCEICPGSGKGDLISAEEITHSLNVIRL